MRGVISTLFFMCVLLGCDSTLKNEQCNKTEKVLGSHIEGRLLKVYENELNHAKTISYVHNQDTLKSLMFVIEQTKLFDNLEPGDIVLKPKGTLNFTWIRNGVENIARLDYGCNDNVKTRVLD